VTDGCRDLEGFKLCLLSTTLGAEATPPSTRTIMLLSLWLGCWNTFCRDADAR